MILEAVWDAQGVEIYPHFNGSTQKHARARVFGFISIRKRLAHLAI